jgi:hypothetical protein
MQQGVKRQGARLEPDQLDHELEKESKKECVNY